MIKLDLHEVRQNNKTFYLCVCDPRVLVKYTDVIQGAVQYENQTKKVQVIYTKKCDFLHATA